MLFVITLVLNVVGEDISSAGRGSGTRSLRSRPLRLVVRGRGPVATSLRRTRPDVPGLIFQVLLLLSLLFSLAVLAVLLVDVSVRAMPVLETRGVDFLDIAPVLQSDKGRDRGGCSARS